MLDGRMIENGCGSTTRRLVREQNVQRPRVHADREGELTAMPLGADDAGEKQ
jgi:hypothetical protein